LALPYNLFCYSAAPFIEYDSLESFDITIHATTETNETNETMSIVTTTYETIDTKLQENTEKIETKKYYNI